MGSLMISVAPSLRVFGALRTTPSLLGSAGHGGSPLKPLSRVTDSLNLGSFVAGSPSPTDMDQANPASIAESLLALPWEILNGLPSSSSFPLSFSRETGTYRGGTNGAHSRSYHP